MLRWVRSLPGKVADAIAVPAIVGALGLAIAWIAAGRPRDVARAEVTVDAWVLLVGVAGFAVVWGIVGWLAGRRREAGLAVAAQDLLFQADSHASYGEHIRNILDQLQNALAGTIPGVTTEEFIERGVLAAGRDMLRQNQAHGDDVRLSIVVPDGSDFVMRYSAGHSAVGHGRFRLPIADAFSRHAFEQARPIDSPDLTRDPRFRPHPAAERPYRSIISVPLVVGGKVVGVLNAVFTAEYGYDEADYTYVALLAAIVNVALAVREGDNRSDPADG